MAGAADTADWIARLQLQPHPEGGWFRRIYTASQAIEFGDRRRALATSIYYLLEARQPRGRLHANRSDILHFLIDGGPLDYFLVDESGALKRLRLGGDNEPFLRVPGGWWKAAQLDESANRALIAEVVTPGFDYADHYFIEEAEVCARCPQHLASLRPFLELTQAR